MEMHEIQFFSFFKNFVSVLVLYKLVVLLAVLLIKPKAFTFSFWFWSF